MKNRLNINEHLNFDSIDLTAPSIVIKELLNQLPVETNDLIHGEIRQYSGPVMSYIKKDAISSISAALGNTNMKVDIQSQLGKIGSEIQKYECYLYTPNYDKYHYRMFFVKHNISNYPVTIILENSIVESISSDITGYTFTCNTREELEELTVKILTSKRVISVMQELIRINQSQKPFSDIEEEFE